MTIVTFLIGHFIYLEDLLLLQDYVCTHALLQQTELLVEGTQPSKPLGQRPGRRP